MLCNHEFFYVIYSAETGTVVEIFTNEDGMLERFNELEKFFPGVFDFEAISLYGFIHRIKSEVKTNDDVRKKSLPQKNTDGRLRKNRYTAR